MKTYIYNADIYCEDCGEAIKADLIAKGNAPENPDDETTFDSDDFPKGPFEDEASDFPQHCGAGADCLNATVLSDGTKIGVFLENPLTTDGRNYVKEKINEKPNEINRLWAEHYDLLPDEDEDDDEE